MSKRASKAGAPAEWPAKVGDHPGKPEKADAKEVTLASILAEQADKPTCKKCGFQLKANGECTICAVHCFVCGFDLDEKHYCSHCKAQRDSSGR